MPVMVFQDILLTGSRPRTCWRHNVFHIGRETPQEELEDVAEETDVWTNLTKMSSRRPGLVVENGWTIVVSHSTFNKIQNDM